MMKTIELILEPGDSEVTYYIPVKDACRLVGFVASVNEDNSGENTAKVQIGKDTDYVLEGSLTLAVGATVTGSYVSTTETKRKQIFDKDEPVTVHIENCAANTIVGLQLIVDPFVIGKHTGFAD